MIRVSNKMRIEFFRSILRQDIGYFDVHSSAEDRFQNWTVIYQIGRSYSTLDGAQELKYTALE